MVSTRICSRLVRFARSNGRECVGSLFPQEHALELSRPFEEAEIKAGVFGCARDKSQGPDGFSVAFYQDFWEILKDDLLSVFTEFWNSGVINNMTNETHLCLIP